MFYIAKTRRIFNVLFLLAGRSKRSTRKNNSSGTRYWYFLGWTLFILVLIDAAYLFATWPDWEKYARGPIAKSEFIRAYEEDRREDPRLPPVNWHPIPYKSIPAHMIRAVIVAEDAAFYKHDGIDVQALKDAIDYNLEKGRIVYGSSTISQQTVKNLFLSSSRNPLRKLHEFILTIAFERKLSKRRILELYLNIAEFGPGVYGIDAAAKHYWNIPASQLSTLQAIELAATLPAPVRHNPKTRTRFFTKRVHKLVAQFGYKAPERPTIENILVPFKAPEPVVEEIEPNLEVTPSEADIVKPEQ